MSLLRNWNQPAILATESTPAEELDLVTEMPEESVEAALLEVETEEAELDALVRDGEDLQTDTAAIEAQALVVEGAMGEDHPGLSEQAAAAVMLSCEAFTQRWGVKAPKLAVESFSPEGDAKQATVLAAESIKDTLKEMWQRVVDFINAIITKAKAWFAKLTDAGKKIQKRVAEYQKKVEALKEDNKDAGKVKGGFIGQLTIEGKANAQRIQSIAGGVNKASKFFKDAEAVVKETTDIVSGGEVKGISLDDFKKSLETIGETAKTKLDKLVPEDAVGATAQALPGNKYLVFYVVESKKGEETLQVPHMNIVGGAEKVEKELPALTIKEMQSALAAADLFGKELTARVGDYEKVAKALDKLAKEMKSATKDVADAEGGDKAVAQYNAKVVNAVVRVAQMSQKAYNGVCRDGGMGLTGYVAASIKEQKADGKKEEKKADK